MRNRLMLSAALGLFILGNAQAQITCPLTNSSLSDLRSAAAKLATTVTLSASCQAYQDNINRAGAELTTIANQISTLDPLNPLNLPSTDTTATAIAATPDAETLRRQQLAAKAIENLNSLNNIFKSEKCGEEVAGFLDYADGFTDMVTGVSPFLALYGGVAAAPWVLGTTIGGAAAKMVIGFFKGKDIDMRKSDQSQAFIKNSCTFYAFNQVKMSLDSLRLNQMPVLEVQLNAAKEALSTSEKSGPLEPQLPLYLDQQASAKDKEKIIAVQARIVTDPLEACSYIGRYARLEDARVNKGLVDRVWDLYIASVKSTTTDLAWEKDYFMSQLNTPLQSIPADRATCLDLATRWTNKMISIADAGQTAAKKIISETEEMKPYLAWVNAQNVQKANIVTLEAKLKFFKLVDSPGFNIESSEINSSHERVQDTLFRSYRFLSLIKMRGLAEAWLNVKYEDGVSELNEYKRRKREVEERLGKIQETIGMSVPLTETNIRAFATNYQARHHKEHRDVHRSVTVDVCTQLRKAWSTWYTGLVHAEAGKDYCIAFDDVIDNIDYPQVQRLCFGRNTRRSAVRTGSLRNLVEEIKSYRGEAMELANKMRSLSCRQARETTQELLRTNFDNPTATTTTTTTP